MAPGSARRRRGAGLRRDLKLFWSAGATCVACSFPGDPKLDPRSQLRTSDAQLSHLLLPDSEVWGRGRGGATEARGPRSLALLSGDGGARASSPRSAAGAVPGAQGQCQARVRVPAAAEARAGLGRTSLFSVSGSEQDAELPRGSRLAAFTASRLAARGNRRLTWSTAAPREPGWASAQVRGRSVLPAPAAARWRELGQRRGSAGERPPPGPAPRLAAPPSRPRPSSRTAPAKGAAPPRRALSVCFSCPTDVSQNIGHMFSGNKLGTSANTLGLRWLFQLPHGGGVLPPCVGPDPPNRRVGSLSLAPRLGWRSETQGSLPLAPPPSLALPWTTQLVVSSGCWLNKVAIYKLLGR